MKNIILLFIIFAFFSCKKKEYEISNLLVETLIESSNFYQNECEIIEESIRHKYNDYGKESGKFDTLILIKGKIEDFYKVIKSKDKKEMIAMQKQKIEEINFLNSEYKIKQLDREKLEALDQKIVFNYIKYQLYKDMYTKYNSHIRKMPIYCGYNVLSDKQHELIEIIKKSNIK